MRLILPILLLAVPAFAQEDDAAHRADRLTVQRLNSRSANGYAPSDRWTSAPDDDGQRAYARAQAAYRERLAEWRRRVAACEAGQFEACR